MFAKEYFAARHFAPRYFPEFGLDNNFVPELRIVVSPHTERSVAPVGEDRIVISIG